jgi:WD40 repeat protein
MDMDQRGLMAETDLVSQLARAFMRAVQFRMKARRLWALTLLLSGFTFAQSNMDWSLVESRLTLLRALFVLDLAFSPNGSRIATAHEDGFVRVWDVTDGLELLRFKASEKRVEGLAFSPSGDLIATASNDGTARVWEARSGVERQRFEREWTAAGDLGIVESIAFHPDGRRLVTGNWNGEADLWEVSSGTLIRRFAGEGIVRDVTFNPNGRSLLTAGNQARLWDVESGQQIRRFSGDAYGVNGVAFSPDGNLMATAGGDGRARVWAVASGLEGERFAAQPRGLNIVAFAPSGRVLATTGGDGTLRLWAVSSGAELKRWDRSGPNVFTRAAFSTDGTRLAVGGYPFFTALYGTTDFAPVFMAR